MNFGINFSRLEGGITKKGFSCVLTSGIGSGVEDSIKQVTAYSMTDVRDSDRRRWDGYVQV